MIGVSVREIAMTTNAAAGVPQSQLDKFKEAARELETDDDPERFKERLGKIARAKPKPVKPE
jgi:hypothetical protein